MVARSVRRCAALDLGGFDAAFSEDIAPMFPAVRAYSQDKGNTLLPVMRAFQGTDDHGSAGI
ncbi:hypothetical protein CWM61_04695 [Klebsiella sp. K-Nf6]|nr:hypothetical protein CWM61_04695 [Klebsiella sp. K-Nf6]